MIGIVITLTLFSNSMFILRRNPLTVAFGIQTHLQYIAKTSPSYASLIQLVDKLPQDARIYNLFEPRTYALPRLIQPDVINSNFSHNLYLYTTPSNIISHWKAQGYTHIIIYNTGVDFLSTDPEGQFTPAAQNALREVRTLLELFGHTPDEVYSVYRIP